MASYLHQSGTLVIEGASPDTYQTMVVVEYGTPTVFISVYDDEGGAQIELRREDVEVLYEKLGKVLKK
jgi:hypothetical protein